MNSISTSQLDELQASEGRWKVVRDGTAIRTELQFADFASAWGFMTQIAVLAEKADHHPEWSNVYSKVVIELTTHDAQGLSSRDYDLAKHINERLAHSDVRAGSS